MPASGWLRTFGTSDATDCRCQKLSLRQGFRGSLLYTSKQTQKSAEAEWLLLHLLKWCYRLWIQLVIALLAVPILIQVFFNSALVYWLNRVGGEKQHHLPIGLDRSVQLH